MSFFLLRSGIFSPDSLKERNVKTVSAIDVMNTTSPTNRAMAIAAVDRQRTQDQEQGSDPSFRVRHRLHGIPSGRLSAEKALTATMAIAAIKQHAEDA